MFFFVLFFWNGGRERRPLIIFRVTEPFERQLCEFFQLFPEMNLLFLSAIFPLFLRRGQCARNDVQKDGLDQTALTSVSATTGAIVTLKLGSVSVLKVSQVTGECAGSHSGPRFREETKLCFLKL